MLLEFTPVEGCVVVAQRFIDLIDKEQPLLVAVAGVGRLPARHRRPELFAVSTRALEDVNSRGPRIDRRRTGRRLTALYPGGKLESDRSRPIRGG